MRPLPVALAVLLALLTLPVALPQADDHPPGEEAVPLPLPDGDAPHAHLTGHFTGTGISHGFNETLGFRPANVTQNWTLVDGTAVVAHVTAPTYSLLCHDGAAYVVHANGSMAVHTCSLLGGRSTPTLTVVILDADGRPALDTHVTVDEANSTTYALLADAAPPNPWPGFVVTLTALLLAAAGAVLAWLYVSERRISRYLVRRLFEETRGQLPKEWPEHLRRRVIARFVVGGKN